MFRFEPKGMIILRVAFLLIISLLDISLLGSALAIAQSPSTKPNVLFIAIDDLNHWVGHLNRHPQTKTPHLDRLAKMGVSFSNAHCAAPVCNPSRAALMSGLRPGSTGVYDNGQDWMTAIDRDKTLTSQFLDAGYLVYGCGKIYHADAHRDGEWTEYGKKSNPGMQKPHPDAKNDGVGGIKFQPLTDDSTLPDEAIVDYGIEKLKIAHERPFFLAIGLHKPHMPWNVPKRYFDRFPLDSIQLPPTQENDLSDVPAAGLKMANRAGDHAKILASGRWKEAVQAYLAAISYCDEQVGRLIDAYDASPSRENTILVLWGDHGWSLGEKEHWRKFALWEETTRMPFLWVVPGETTAGKVCPAPVDLMSLYPTLCDLCGIRKPEHVEGENIRMLLKSPELTWNRPAITTFHRKNHAIRTSRYRLIQYADGSEELYDHESDPYEWKNLAQLPSMASTLTSLRQFVPHRNEPELPNKR